MKFERQKDFVLYPLYGVHMYWQHDVVTPRTRNAMDSLCPEKAGQAYTDMVNISWVYSAHV